MKTTILFIGILFFSKCQFTKSSTTHPPIVLTTSYHQHSKHKSPWTTTNIRKNFSIGVIIKNSDKKLYILTTASLVQNSKKIELQKIGESKRYEAQVKFIDHEINLALIAPNEKHFFDNEHPVRLAKNLKRNASLIIYKQQTQKNVIKDSSKLSTIELSKSKMSSYSYLNYILKKSSNTQIPAPVFYKKKLAGIISHLNSKQLHVIPSTLIRHFLKDKHDKNYKGFPSLGIMLAPLISPKTKTALNVPENTQGVRVTKILPYSQFHELKKDDVIVKVNNLDLDETGLVSHPLWGKVHFVYYVNKLYSGESISLTVLQNGVETIITKTIYRHKSNSGRIQYYSTTDKVPYIIQGGFVFQELSLDFLKSWGYSWKTSSPTYLYYLWKKNNYKQPLNEKYIIISQIIQDKFNKGYENLSNSVLQSINGTDIHSLEDVKKVFNNIKNKSSYLVIKTHEERGDIILSTKNIDKVNKRIALNYGIRGN